MLTNNAWLGGHNVAPSGLCLCYAWARMPRYIRGSCRKASACGSCNINKLYIKCDLALAIPYLEVWAVNN